ncbi:MAG: hypothetical protein CO143_03400 [Candidatus Moranbacteria bacterium CG_4_9_14_3_um_filter_45_14]|nr:MAG: hypothetical protein CO143_03400 [Candidatus Moranbacteria bacterium CG_4_9_14_3_um_filter_45_14]
MSSPFRQQPSQLSDIRPVSRPEVLKRPKMEYGQTDGGYTPLFFEAPVSRFEPDHLKWSREDLMQKQSFLLRKQKRILFAFILFLCAGIGISFVIYRAENVKNMVLADGERGYGYLASAVEDIQSEQWGESSSRFDDAYRSFSHGTESLSSWGGSLFTLTRFVPGLSKIASGKSALEAGKHFASAGISLNKITADFALSKETYMQGNTISFLDFLSRVKIPLEETLTELEAGNQALKGVDIKSVPKDKQEKFLLVRKSLPTLIGLIKNFDQHKALFEELLGGNGPRKYLFLLQNNQEMRATGGFIGTYALMDVNDGVVRRFFVDGIFNPDGQLRENIVPPKAIQKVSAAWSLHDSNWFPDFPMSAEKAIFFYEKTGGSTVDGVITLTPTVMQQLLSVTGPITLPQYGLTVDADNFIPIIQEQVETKYDKEENQPKKVLADLTALLIEKVFASQDKMTLYRIANALVKGLNEKQMLLYMRHPQTEALIDGAGWSGRVLPTSKDYLSVIHTNINGYKTDGVIDETIKHTAEISTDGSIVDTVFITRTHRGGNTPYIWWNKVNADYMRVYVPEGSKLLSAQGATWEFPEAPLDYQALGFKRDVDVEREENSLSIDEKSGTRVYQDSGKTVFGAWVYVSPQESVTVEYRYRLPFTIDMNQIHQGGADSYAILYQKQSGSLGSKLFSSVLFPDGIEPVWQTSGNLIPYSRQWKLETDLKTDVFAGMVFGTAK